MTRQGRVPFRGPALVASVRGPFCQAARCFPVGTAGREMCQRISRRVPPSGPVTGTQDRPLRQEFSSLRSRLPTLWSRSFFVATVGAVSAATVQRYIDTQYERPWLKGGPS